MYLFLFFWLCWVFVAARRISPVAASGGYSLLQCAGLSLRWPLLLQSTGSRHAGLSSCGSRASVVVARGLQSAGPAVVVHRLSRSAACGLLPGQGSNPCPLRWQADSQPLRHQGSPCTRFCVDVMFSLLLGTCLEIELLSCCGNFVYFCICLISKKLKPDI